jgi:hypothetical protein
MTPATMSKNVHHLADQYRSLLRLILIEQAVCECACLWTDLWSERYRQINYLCLTAVFINNNYEMISSDLCCCQLDEVVQKADSVLKVLKSIE